MGFFSNVADALKSTAGELKKRPTFEKDLPITPPFNPNEMPAMPSVGGLPSLATGATAAPVIAPPAAAAPSLDLSGKGVPIPQLPSRSGGPRPFDEAEKAKYDYMSEGMRDSEGNLGNKVPRRWKDVAMNALVGGLKGASASPENPLAGLLGGAATGGIGTAIDPAAGREFRFDTTMRPGVEADTARGKAGDEQEYQKKKRAAEYEEILAGIAGRNAQTDAARDSLKNSEMERSYRQSQMELNKSQAEIERSYRQSQIDVNRARQEALLKGKPVIKDLADEDGKVRTYQIFPDGTQIPVGGSAADNALQKRLDTRKDIAAGANATRTNIETMKEGGRNSRSAGKKTAAGSAKDSSAPKAKLSDMKKLLR